MVRFPPCQSFEPVPASPAQRSGRSFGPRDSTGTLQLSTRCSSADLSLSRSLAVRAGSAANCFLAISCDDAVPYAATAQLHPNNIAATRLMFEYIVEPARASLMQWFELPPCSIPGQAPTQRPIAPVCHSGPRLGPQMRRLIAFASPCKRPELAWELDVIKRHGIERKLDLIIDTLELASTEAGKVALKGGSVDLILSDWLWVARERSLGDTLVFYPASTALGAVMTPAQSSIRSVLDLKDKKLAIAGGPLDKSASAPGVCAARRHRS